MKRELSRSGIPRSLLTLNLRTRISDRHPKFLEDTARRMACTSHDEPFSEKLVDSWSSSAGFGRCTASIQLRQEEHCNGGRRPGGGTSSAGSKLQRTWRGERRGCAREEPTRNNCGLHDLVQSLGRPLQIRKQPVGSRQIARRIRAVSAQTTGRWAYPAGLDLALARARPQRLRISANHVRLETLVRG